MPEDKVKKSSEQLCNLLGVSLSDKQADKVFGILSELVTEITTKNTRTCNNIIRSYIADNPQLAKQITDDIRTKRDLLIANLSALR